MIRSSPSQGSVLIETVIALPLFLLLIFFLLFLGDIINARSSLVSAVDNGLRAASTRGNPDLMQFELIPALNEFDGNISSVSKNKESFRSLFYYQTEDDDGFTLYHQWHRIWDKDLNDEAATNKQFGNLPEYYKYALAFIHSAMKKSLAGEVRFPCEPDAEDGEGCLKCTFLNPCTLKNNSLSETSCQYSESFARIAVQCEYRPSGALINPISNLLSFYSDPNQQQNFKLRYRSFWDTPKDIIDWHNPL